MAMQIQQLVYQIAEYIKTEQLPQGTRLPGRKLAEQFRVPRSPIQRALRLLENHQVVASSGNGYVVHSSPASISLEGLGEKRQTDDELLYLRLAEDHATGQLPEKMSENELMRRYGTSRAKILRILLRAAGERWVERRPGRGWAFVPLLTRSLTYESTATELSLNRLRSWSRPLCSTRRLSRRVMPSRSRCSMGRVLVYHRLRSSRSGANFIRPF